MGCIQTTSCGAADSGKVTVSMWFKPPSVADTVALYGDNPNTNNLLVSIEDASHTWCFNIMYNGFIRNGGTSYSYAFQVNAGRADNLDVFAAWSTVDNFFDAYQNGLNMGGWNHLFASIDTNHVGPYPSGNFGQGADLSEIERPVLCDRVRGRVCNCGDEGRCRCDNGGEDRV